VEHLIDRIHRPYRVVYRLVGLNALMTPFSKDSVVTPGFLEKGFGARAHDYQRQGEPAASAPPSWWTGTPLRRRA
jgi:hypothetical protein